MAKEWANAFYQGIPWRECKNAYLSKVGRLCERCIQQGKIVPAEIVHHKIPITMKNITNPQITLNHDNLQALCRDCHADVHRKNVKRWSINKDGTVTAKEDTR